MVVSFRKAKNENFLARVLDGKDADFQKRVLAIAVEHGLKTSDPLFLVMLATGQLQVLLEDKPSELNNLFERWSEAICDRLETAKHTAIKGQEIEISRAVERLIAKAESKERSRLRVMLPAAGLLLAAMGLGVLGGMAVPVWWQGGYAPGEPRQLTVTELEMLSWAKSFEGRLARNILKWNSESLTNLNCTRNAAQRSVVQKERGKRALSQYCLLRVKAP